MLYFEQFGNGETIVFLHGALVSSTMWKKQIGYFKGKFNIIVFDLPEHGKSKDAILQNYTVQELSSSIFSTLDKLNVKSFHLCGHSLGGMVAQEIALSHPEMIRNLILAETSFGTRNSISEKMSSSLASLFMKLMTQKQLVNMSSSSYGKANPDTKEYIRQEMSLYSIKQSCRVMSAALNYSSKARLENLQIKTLILVGELNKQTHKQASMMNKVIKHSKLISIPNAHHILNMDNPDYFNKVVYDFLIE
jgi:pimeloyl-ACP methyl ester carboxylesterase